MNLKELNQAWHDFIKAQRLLIVLELDEVSMHFLDHIVFEKPIYRNTKRLIEHRIDIRYVGKEIKVEPEDIDFNLGLFEFEQKEEKFLSNWEIDSDRTEENPTSFGDDVEFFLESFSIPNKDAAVIEEFLYLFKLKEKIELAYVSEKKINNRSKNKELMEKYNDKPIQVIEKDGDLFILLHDGEKVQLTYNE